MNATTIATQMINEARSKFGAMDAIDLPRSMWEEVMDEVTAAGGEVGFDYCLVDGCRVGGGMPDDDRRAAVHLPDRAEPEYLALAGGSSA